MLINKYYKIYMNLIESRIKNPTISDYHEKHHIIPKSLGGNNSKSNIVKLTAREHFIAHLLLIRIFEGDSKCKMQYALIRMLQNPFNTLTKLNSRYYEIARKENKKALQNKIVSEETRKKMSIAQKGRIVSPETKVKLSESAKKKIGDKNPFFGKKHSEESLKKQSESKLGIKQSEESKKKRSLNSLGEKNHFFGKKHSEETKKKISDAAKKRHLEKANSLLIQ